MNDLAPQFSLLGGINNITGAAPLGANDPAVHHVMMDTSKSGVLAPGALPSLFSENDLFAGVAEGLSIPLPANAAEVYEASLLQPSPFVQGHINLGNSMTQTGLTGSLAEALAWGNLLNPGAQADMFSMGVMSSNNAIIDAVNGHNIASQAIQDGNFIETSSGGMIISTDSLLTTG